MKMLTLIILCLLSVDICVAKYSGGKGEPNDPYLIATAEDLNDIANHTEDFDKHFVLTNDIDLSTYSGSEFNIIGSGFTLFTGVFDGGGHRITNFTYVGEPGEIVGLFGWLDSNAEVRNLGLTDVDISNSTVDNPVGGLVAMVLSGSITNCYVTGSISSVSAAGGLVSVVFDGSVTNCYFIGSVAGADRNTGGLVAQNGGQIRECYSDAIITGNLQVGGLVGINLSGVIIDSYSTGEVYGGDFCTGGLAGCNSDGGVIVNCYSSCSVYGISLIGGLIGYNNNSEVTSSFWDVQISGQDNMCGQQVGGGTGCDDTCGKTTPLMQTMSTYSNAGWDFVGETINGPNDIWTINEGEDYPKLVWDIVNFDGFNGVNFVDYSFFANHWLQTNCPDSNDCDGADFDFSGEIDFLDLKIFCQHWLEGT